MLKLRRYVKVKSVMYTLQGLSDYSSNSRRPAEIKNKLLQQDPSGKNVYIANKSEFVERILKEVNSDGEKSL